MMNLCVMKMLKGAEIGARKHVAKSLACMYSETEIGKQIICDKSVEVTSFFTVDKKQERCMVQPSRPISEHIIEAKAQTEPFCLEMHLQNVTSDRQVCLNFSDISHTSTGK